MCVTGFLCYPHPHFHPHTSLSPVTITSHYNTSLTLIPHYHLSLTFTHSSLSHLTFHPSHSPFQPLTLTPSLTIIPHSICLSLIPLPVPLPLTPPSSPHSSLFPSLLPLPLTSPSFSPSLLLSPHCLSLSLSPFIPLPLYPSLPSLPLTPPSLLPSPSPPLQGWDGQMDGQNCLPLPSNV